jgi:hypothetical protein
MPGKPRVRRGCVKRSNIQHACIALHARTSGSAATHVSSSPSHSSGALIGSRRASYARQATRENRVRETIQYATCVHCVACSNERERGDPCYPSHSSGALIDSYRAMLDTRRECVNRLNIERAKPRAVCFRRMPDPSLEARTTLRSPTARLRTL